MPEVTILVDGEPADLDVITVTTVAGVVMAVDARRRAPVADGEERPPAPPPAPPLKFAEG